MTHEQRQDALAATREAFARIEEFARRLLLDERLVAGTTPEWSIVPVTPLVERVTRDHTVTASDKHVEIKAVVEPDCPPILAGDLHMVHEVLDNLVGNAVKYAPSNAAVQVTARAEGDDFVRFDVADNGIGIPSEVGDGIFAVFQRPPRCEEYPGNGVGLAICRRIVERHGGVIWFDSTPGVGTIFRFVLPAKKQRA
jgi:signal transduction histidine kinase